MDRSNIDSNTNTNAGMTTLTPEYFVSRWSNPKSLPLIKGRLIDKNGRCCAQGDVLRCAGHSDQQLREITQATADQEVARLLGISLAEAVLLRVVNDEEDGCPQDVFKAPEKVLGPHHKLWTAFARHIDLMSKEDWERVVAAWAAAADAVWDAAWAAARAAACDVAWYAAWYAAGEAAGIAALDAARVSVGDAASHIAWDVAREAARELVGWSRLKEPFFLKMFFPDPQAWVRSIEDEND